MAILRVWVVFVVMMIGIVGNLRGVEGAISANSGQNIKGWENPLTDSEAEKVKEIWREIKTQEIVGWNGEKWLELSTVDKEEAINKAREAWGIAGYKNIESAEYFVEDIDKFYNHHMQKEPQKAKEKIGLTLSLSAFFAGMERE